ncbi:MAG: sulfate ABC transporter permease subunit CysW [Gemmatimonadetes bacterium]|nr:sulfate ABC transporter permease subunit CysW [Gemmatimonadota bacterium]
MTPEPFVAHANLRAPGQAVPMGARDPAWVRRSLIGVTVTFLGSLLIAPLALILTQAFARGWSFYASAITDPEALSAIRLTLLAAAVAVPVNVAFGIAAAWCLGKFEFRGKGVLTTLIDLPFAVSPVIAGMVFVLLFGLGGWLGPLLDRYDMRIVYAVPGILIATLFVTFPFVARELVHLMETQGVQEEEAARLMGASGWTILTRITLPNARWALFYGIVLCNARAMGEFGAVSVVSGHIRGRTNTLPLHVEILYNEYNYVAAFAVASVLMGLAIVTLVLKAIAERHVAERPSVRPGPPPGHP